MHPDTLQFLADYNAALTRRQFFRKSAAGLGIAAVTAYREAFGFDAPPYTYADFEESDVIVLWGSNLCIAHPILWQRVMRNRRSPKIIVVDPRATETAQAATQHIALRPKTDLTLAYGLAQLLIARGASP